MIPRLLVQCAPTVALLTISLLTGCSGTARVDGGTDAADLVTESALVDSPRDVAIDAGVDAGADVAIDAGVDAGADVAIDAGVDAGADVAIDAGVDAGTDVVIDARADAIADTSTTETLAPTCSDAIRNGSETDVDCGGPSCMRCALTRGCLTASDCVSAHCVSGHCAQCEAAADCPGTDTECHTRTCVAGTCGSSNTAMGFRIAAQTPGTCQASVCDGAGAVVSVVDNTNVPVDGQACTLDVCAAGVPSNPPAPAGTACGTAGVCNGAGGCGVCVPGNSRPCCGTSSITCCGVPGCCCPGTEDCDATGHWGVCF